MKHDRPTSASPTFGRAASETLRRATAFHEAGHAVMSVLSGLSVKSASIEPDATEGTWGQVRHSTGGLARAAYSLSGSTWKIDRVAMVTMAGGLCEWHVQERFHHSGLAGDLGGLMDLTRTRPWAVRTQRAWVLLLWHRTIDELVWPPAWRMVESVATALLAGGRLSGPKVRDTMFRPSATTSIGDEAVEALNARLHSIRCPFLFRVENETLPP